MGDTSLFPGSQSLFAVYRGTSQLKNGKGSCRLKPKRLHVGTYHLSASYPGSATFAKSASGKVSLTVTK